MPSITQAYKKFSLLFLVLLLVACQNEPALQRIQGDALGTTYSILYVDNQPNETLAEAVDAVFLRANQSMSTYWPNSIISKINRDEAIKTDKDLRQVFAAARAVWQATDGFFDPTVGALVNAYGFGPDQALSSITASVLDSIMQFTGFEKLRLQDDYVVKEDPRVYIDFNAIGKGYAVDELAKALENLGYSNFLVEVGGELFAKGVHPLKNMPWRVAIDHPEQNDKRKFIATFHYKTKVWHHLVITENLERTHQELNTSIPLTQKQVNRSKQCIEHIGFGPSTMIGRCLCNCA